MNGLFTQPWMLLGDEAASFWFPEKASTFAGEVDFVYDAILYISLFFFALIVIGMVYFVWKYRQRPGYEGSPEALHNNVLEVTWTVIPTLIVVWIFWRGVVGYIDMMTPPADTYDIQVKAIRWNWSFTYPNGAISPDLHIPINTPVKLIMRSDDVIHSLYVPAFRAKTDVVPGRLNIMWFEGIKEGIYDLYCTEYCGTKHSVMQTLVHVEPQAKFDAWLAEASKPPTDPVEWGKWLYERQGCKGCHSMDGSLVVGPSFKGSFGTSLQMSSGETVTMDENYIRTSILNPQKQARTNFANKINQMNSYQGKLKEEEIGALTAFIKSLK
jgi:cytochrome c oxidase subunit 2